MVTVVSLENWKAKYSERLTPLGNCWKGLEKLREE
jgi:hypothetical protein